MILRWTEHQQGHWQSLSSGMTHLMGSCSCSGDQAPRGFPCHDEFCYRPFVSFISGVFASFRCPWQDRVGWLHHAGMPVASLPLSLSLFPIDVFGVSSVWQLYGPVTGFFFSSLFFSLLLLFFSLRLENRV